MAGNAIVIELVCRYLSSEARAVMCLVSHQHNTAAVTVSKEYSVFAKYQQYMQPCVKCADGRHKHTCGLALGYQIPRSACDDIFTCYHTFVRVKPQCRLKHAACGSLAVFKILARHFNDFSAALHVASTCNNIPVIEYICALDHTNGRRSPEDGWGVSPVFYFRVVDEATIIYAALNASWSDNIHLLRTILYTREYLRNYVLRRLRTSARKINPIIEAELTSTKRAGLAYQ